MSTPQPVWTAFANNTSLEVGGFTVSASATILAIVLTAYLIFRHLKHWTDAIAQKHIVRILLMVPVYATASLLAIVIGQYSLFFTLVRDCYEAYVLHQFFSLLEHYLKEEAPNYFVALRGGIDEGEETGTILSNFGETPFPFPLCCGCTYQPGKRFFLHIKRCSLQYVFIKPILSAIAILLQILGLYNQTGVPLVKRASFWISILLNISSLLAVYFIFLFYELIKKVIQDHRPLAKLVSIKVLVFFVFWQSLIVAALYYFELLPAFFGWSPERSSDTVQNILVCLEMTLLSFFNLYAFPYQNYRTESGDNTLDNTLTNIQSVINHKDFVDDTVDAFHLDRVKHAIIKKD